MTYRDELRGLQQAKAAAEELAAVERERREVAEAENLALKAELERRPPASAPSESGSGLLDIKALAKAGPRAEHAPSDPGPTSAATWVIWGLVAALVAITLSFLALNL